MRLYIGNLSWNTDEEILREAFSTFGELDDVKVVTDRETGRSRGFGFITFSEKDDALNAIEAMDGQDLDGRPLKVNEAREREPRRSGGGGGRNRW
jgi:RNA recognition motif-containing protein